MNFIDFAGTTVGGLKEKASFLSNKAEDLEGTRATPNPC